MTVTRTSTRSRPTENTRAGRLLVPLAIGVVAVATLVASMVLAGSAYEPPAPGLPDPGAGVGWGLPVVLLGGVVAGVLTCGWLLGAAFLDPQGAKGVVSPVGRADLVRAAWASAVWAVLAVAAFFLTLADILGVPLSQALSPDLVQTYAWELPQTQAYALVALVAVVVAVGAALTATVGTAAAWLLLALIGLATPSFAGHGSGLGDHALALTAGLAHVVASALWVGGLVALALHAWRRDPGMVRSARAFSRVAMVAVTVLALSGLANAYTRMDSPTELLTTDYGRLVLAKIVLLGVLLVLAARMRARILPGLEGPGGRLAFAKLALVEITLMAAAIGVAVAMSRTAFPRVEESLPSYAETLLGYPFPPEPTIARVALGWIFDPFFLTASLVAAGLYVYGVARLRARGDRWPWGRTVAWLLGIGTVIWSTSAGIAVYAPASFSMHMLQHMTLSMVSPILLVLGAPTTLALRAIRPAPPGQRGPREWIVWALHTPFTKFITHPLWVLFVYTVGLYGLYFTPMFATLMGTHLGHVLMQVHFLAAGYLFYWVVIGVDPTPRRLPHWARLLLLLASIVIHSFFAVPIMMSEVPLAVEWYGVVQPPWITDLVAETNVGGGIAWGFGEVPSLIVLVALSVQWARSDEREARRHDRKADRDGDADLKAYNAHLAALADRHERHERATAPRDNPGR
ncbi:MAG: cytochrome c oxidase assembly protein [Candidatus Nanopelagicales bacterium]